MLRPFVAAALALASCSSAPTWDRGPEFVLCNDSNDGFVIRINYQDLTGIYEDYGMQVGACGDIASGCINHPILLSIPPNRPTVSEPVVHWSVEGYRFTMERGSARPGHYSIIAEGHQSDGQSIGRDIYDYDGRNGIVRYRAEGVARVWTRCAGRLTFGDLRELRARLR